VAGKRFMMVGTAGYDFVQALKRDEKGYMHMFILDAPYILDPQNGGATPKGGTIAAGATANTQVSTYGVFQEPKQFPIAFANGERFYGDITLSGSDAYYTTTNDIAGNDPMAVLATTTGKTYVMHLASLPNSGVPYANFATLTHANYGGVTVVHVQNGATSTDYVVGQANSKIQNIVINNAGIAGTSSPNKSLNASRGANYSASMLLNWMQRTWAKP